MFKLYVTTSCPGCHAVMDKLHGTAAASKVTIRWADTDARAKTELTPYGLKVPTMVAPNGQVYRNPAEILRALGL